MQQHKKGDVFCETTCKSFRCSEKFLKITRIRGKKQIMCQMVEDDECIGYKCKFAVCFFRPPALDISTGTCAQKIKYRKPQRPHKSYREDSMDDPLKYRKLLDKKLQKNLKIKDFY
ncbi:MAG: hypothetical protein ACFFAE_18480 [Candidatus Hodarchaeota archaeon]